MINPGVNSLKCKGITTDEAMCWISGRQPVAVGAQGWDIYSLSNLKKADHVVKEHTEEICQETWVTVSIGS